MKKRISLLLTVLITALCLTLVACDGFNDDDDHVEKIIDVNMTGKGGGNSGLTIEDGKLIAAMEVLHGDVYGFEMDVYVGNEHGYDFLNTNIIVKCHRNGEDFNIFVDLKGRRAHLMVLGGNLYVIDDDQGIYAIFIGDDTSTQEFVAGLAEMAGIADEFIADMGDSELRDTGEDSFNGGVYFYEEYYDETEDAIARAYYDGEGNLVGFSETGLETPFVITKTPDMSNFIIPSHYREVGIDSYDINIDRIFETFEMLESMG